MSIYRVMDTEGSVRDSLAEAERGCSESPSGMGMSNEPFVSDGCLDGREALD